MGFLDKMKGAMNAVTGGAAKVTIEANVPCGLAGQQIGFRVTAVSAGAEVNTNGIFVDIKGTEEIRYKDDNNRNQTRSSDGFKQSFQIAPAGVIAAGETQVYEGMVQLPNDLQPSYNGRDASHKWTIRGRVDAKGNDPDSGYQPFRIMQQAQ